MGRQITGKVQSVLVVITLVGDIILAICVIVLIANRAAWAANWESPSPIDWWTIFTIAGLWLGIMAGIMEVQQVLVDEWSDFGKSRDVGLLSAAWQLWGRQIPLALGVLSSLPLAALVVMPVPTVGVVENKYGHNALFYLALGTMVIATYTTLSVYFMGMGRIVALYAQQGALPRAVGRYSSRSVPWVAIVLLAGFALIGAYWTDFAFVASVLSTWSVTLYFVVALVYLLMKRRTDLDRPLTAKVRDSCGVVPPDLHRSHRNLDLQDELEAVADLVRHRCCGRPLRHVRRPAHQARPSLPRAGASASDQRRTALMPAGSRSTHRW